MTTVALCADEPRSPTPCAGSSGSRPCCATPGCRSPPSGSRRSSPRVDALGVRPRAGLPGRAAHPVRRPRRPAALRARLRRLVRRRAPRGRHQLTDERSRGPRACPRCCPSGSPDGATRGDDDGPQIRASASGSRGAAPPRPRRAVDHRARAPARAARAAAPRPADPPVAAPAPARRGAADPGARCARRCAPTASCACCARRDRSRRPRKVVLLIDVSGSMEPYADALLRFAHVVVRRAPASIEVFTLGTRLTRVTRELRLRDPEHALRAAGRAIPDWSGGTRLGEVLRGVRRPLGTARGGPARGRRRLLRRLGARRHPYCSVTQLGAAAPAGPPADLGEPARGEGRLRAGAGRDSGRAAALWTTCWPGTASPRWRNC